MATDNKNTPPRKPNSGDSRTPKNQGGNFLSRNWFWVVLIILVLIGSRFLWNSPTRDSDALGLNELADLVNNDAVEEITVQGEVITVKLNEAQGGEIKRSRKEDDQSVLET